MLQHLQSNIEEILDLMGIQDLVTPTVEIGEDEVIKVDLQHGQDGFASTQDRGEFELDPSDQRLGVLIGPNGETLAAIEYVLALVVNRDRNRDQGQDEWRRLHLDLDGYRQRKMEELVSLAEQVAKQVQEQGQSLSLRPMTNYDRRVIHIALSEHDAVATESIGTGRHRRVVIKPK